MISTLKKEYGDKIDKWAKKIDEKDYKEGKINYYSYPISRRQLIRAEMKGVNYV